MKLCARQWFCIGGVIAVFVWIWVVRAQEPIEDLRVPMDYYEDGTLKSELFARHAEVRPDGNIAARGVVFRQFTATGAEDGVVNAQDALISREHQIATSHRAVSLQRGELRITGQGFTWNGKEGTLRIHRRARVTFPSEMIRAEGVLGNAQ